jgi:hypothetical protein
MSRLARRLLAVVPQARILTLRGTSEPTPGPIGPQGEAGVWRFTPDQPLPREGGRPLPSASSLETLLRRARGRLVFLGVDTEVARATLEHVLPRAWGVREAGRSEAGQLGARLLTLDAGSPEEVADRLAQSLAA